jgi:hypothetical protein
MKYRLFLILLFPVIFACNPKVAKIESPAARSPYHTLYIIKEQINMRSIPGTNGKIVAALQDGDEIQVRSNQKGWYQVISDEGQQGWVRSDLAGPRKLSLTRMASAFADSVMPAFKAELYFDKTELYKVIYLTLDKSYYDTQKKAKDYANKIAEAYQHKVYAGKVEVRVMHHDKEELYFKFYKPAIGLARVPVPVFKHGVLYSLNEINKEVSIKIAVPDSIPGKELLRSARNISAAYDYPFKKAEIYMVTDSPAGMSYLKNPSLAPAEVNICKLYYLEDADGEDYKYNFCK